MAQFCAWGAVWKQVQFINLENDQRLQLIDIAVVIADKEKADLAPGTFMMGWMERIRPKHPDWDANLADLIDRGLIAEIAPDNEYRLLGWTSDVWDDLPPNANYVRWGQRSATHYKDFRKEKRTKNRGY